MAEHSTQARYPILLLYKACISRTSQINARRIDYLHKTASSVAKNINSGLHRIIEMSCIVLIIFEAVTQIFSCHSIPFKLQVRIRNISVNYDVQFNSDPDTINRNKIARLFLRNIVVFIYVRRVSGNCRRIGLVSSTQIMPLYAVICQRIGSRKIMKMSTDWTNFCLHRQHT